jgi:hypothetical protein
MEEGSETHIGVGRQDMGRRRYWIGRWSWVELAGRLLDTNVPSVTMDWEDADCRADGMLYHVISERGYGYRVSGMGILGEMNNAMMPHPHMDDNRHCPSQEIAVVLRHRSRMVVLWTP